MLLFSRLKPLGSHRIYRCFAERFCILLTCYFAFRFTLNDMFLLIWTCLYQNKYWLKYIINKRLAKKSDLLLIPSGFWSHVAVSARG